MILVVGASGLLGTQICRELTQAASRFGLWCGNQSIRRNRNTAKPGCHPRLRRSQRPLHPERRLPRHLDGDLHGLFYPFPPGGRFDRECRSARPVQSGSSGEGRRRSALYLYTRLHRYQWTLRYRGPSGRPKERSQKAASGIPFCNRRCSLRSGWASFGV